MSVEMHNLGAKDSQKVSTNAVIFQPKSGHQQPTVTLQIPSDDISIKQTSENEEDPAANLLFSVNDLPAPHLCVILGLQHILTMIGGLVATISLISPHLCLDKRNDVQAELLATILFVCGISTLLQTTVGVRLPIMQGPSFAFVSATIAVAAMTAGECYSKDLEDGDEDKWKKKLSAISGCMMAGGGFEALIGATGLPGMLKKFIGPLTVGPVLVIIGVSLFDASAYRASPQWGLCLFMVVCLVVTSQIVGRWQVRCLPTCTNVPPRPPSPNASNSHGESMPQRMQSAKSCGGPLRCERFPVFGAFPVIISIGAVWLVTWVVTAAGGLQHEVTNSTTNETTWESGRAAADYRIDAIKDGASFRMPYPGQWHTPVVTLAGAIGMLAGALASIVESLGDYHSCQLLSAAPPLPVHAINRGIMLEGLGCVISGLFSSGIGTTSYSENIGAIGITRVAARRVLQTSGVALCILGVFPKLSGVLIAIPDPIVGGLFLVMFAMVIGAGFAQLTREDMTLPRNMIVVGAGIIFGMAVPKYVEDYENGAIDTGSKDFDDLVKVLLKVNVFIAGLVSFLLDNLLPKVKKQASIEKQMKAKCHNDIVKLTYDIPFISDYIRKVDCLRYIPFLPGYDVQKTAKLLCRVCRKPSSNANANVPPTENFYMSEKELTRPKKSTEKNHAFQNKIFTSDDSEARTSPASADIPNVVVRSFGNSEKARTYSF